MIDTAIHTLGLCGENHLKVIDIFPFYSYIVEYKQLLFYVFRRNWDRLT